MGNCTFSSRKNVAIPSRMIIPKPIPIKAVSAIDPQPITPIGLRFHPSDNQTTGEPDEDIKANYRSLVLKYDLHELGIGEYYLERELAEQKGKIAKIKQKAQVQASIKWDRAVVQMRVRSPQFIQTSVLYCQVDTCLKEYAVLKSKSFAKMLRDGPPMRYRWSVWKNFLELDQFFIPDLYEKLKGLSSPWENDIRKDVHRTFPAEPYFSSERFNYVGQEQLFSVLKAISLYLPNVGYTQSMNFLAAFLLLVSGGNELESFWAFITLARDHRFLMMGFFEKGFPLLQFYMYMFYEMLESEIPTLHEHLKQQQVPDELWLLKWFFTIFLYSLPPKHVIRIWDFILAEGLFGLIKVSLGLLKAVEKDMIQLDAFGIDLLFKYLKNEGNTITNISHVNDAVQNQSNLQNIDNAHNLSNMQSMSNPNNLSNMHNLSNVQNQSNMVQNIENQIHMNNMPSPLYVQNMSYLSHISHVNMNQNTSNNHTINNLHIPSHNTNTANVTHRSQFASLHSANNETSEIQYNIKELNIDEVIEYAENVILTVDKLLYFVDLYPQKANKRLSEPYNQFFKNLHLYQKDLSKIAEFQSEIDFHLLKSELSEKPAEEIVISNLLDDADNSHILKDLAL